MVHLISTKDSTKDNNKKSADNNSKQASKSKSINLQLGQFFVYNYQLLIALICLLVMIGSLFWFFLPQYNKTLADARDDYQKAQQELLDKQKYQANLIQLNDFYKQIDQATRNKVRDILPATLDRENLLAEIEAICLLNSLLIKSSDVTAVENKTTTDNEAPKTTNLSNQPKSAIIKLELQGRSYKSFKGLLKTVENNLHLMDIQHLNYLPDQNQIVLEIQVYYLSD